MANIKSTKAGETNCSHLMVENSLEEYHDDPSELVETFNNLYCERMKSIEDSCANNPQAKISVLQDWIADLTDQNRALVKVVCRLEKEALSRVDQINSAVSVREYEDEFQKPVETVQSPDFPRKICELQVELRENQKCIQFYKCEMEKLKKQLDGKNNECEDLQIQNERLAELQGAVYTLQADIQTKNNTIKCLQEKVESEAVDLKEMCMEANQLKIKISEKDCLIGKLKCTLQEQAKRIEELNKKHCEERASLEKIQAEFEEKELSDLKNGIEKMRAQLLQSECEKDKFCQALGEKENLIAKLQKEKCNLFQKLNQMKQDKENIEKIFKEQVAELQYMLENKNQEVAYLTQIEKTVKNSEAKLKLKFKDVQEALTSEIADKYDEICRLKEDNKALEEKLLQSERHTQYRDEIIKKLRSEVRVGRAKESLAEMLGLKGTPRAAMKEEIDVLNITIEDLKAQNISLEARLEECNLPAVLMLQSRLNQAEGSLLAMFNKMDYVRRYLENLKGDEELSIKCGLEALLNELREDVEWNRQTRRNLSLDEGSSVIVISHRSRSLPDNSLHRIPRKVLPNSPVGSVEMRSVTCSQAPVNCHPGYEGLIQEINELGNNFNKAQKEICDEWNSIKLWSKGSGDSFSRSFGDVIHSSVESDEGLQKMETQVASLLDYQVENECGSILKYLETNLVTLGQHLSNANLATLSSNSELHRDAEKNNGPRILSREITVAINDSISLITELRRKHPIEMPSNFKGCLQDISVAVQNKKRTSEKLVSFRKQQEIFLQGLIRRISGFDQTLNVYNSLAENMQEELHKLFNNLLSKENQIQKQVNEVQYLKSLSSSHCYKPNVEKVRDLRKVVSNKDLQLIEKEEMIHNLRSLNYTLRRTKLSRSSPSINCSGDHNDDFTIKLQQFDESIVTMKGSLSSILSFLLRNQDKMAQFKDSSMSLVQTLAITHKEIMSYKDAISGGQGDQFNISSIDDNLSDAILKVEQLLNAVENFLCDSEKPDLNVMADALRKKMIKLVHVADLIKKFALRENSSLKTLTTEYEEIKKKEIENNEAVNQLNERLEKANADLQALYEEYSNLKKKKEEIESKDQKVMEELQAKISSLQEAASLQSPKALENENLKKDLEEWALSNEEQDMKIKKLRNECSSKTKENSNLKKHLEDLAITIEQQTNEIERLQKGLLLNLKKNEGTVVSEGELFEHCQQLTGQIAMQTEENKNLERTILDMKEEFLSTHSKNILEAEGRIHELEQMVSLLSARLYSKDQCIAERDEIIKIFESQLKASTEFIMEDSDKEEICGLDTKHHSGLAERYASCKLKLQHAMQQNWRLVTMLNKLQSIKYSLICGSNNTRSRH